jgi:hypothetical protein|tara:strand:+ start:4624 stop:6384 length:1761 start_codon:yes stop_codon:yes gene_type:complete
MPKIYIPICDNNLWVLKIYAFLFEKFWGNEQQVVIMGFSKPEFSLPDNFSFVSLAKEQIGGAKKWTRYIYNYLSTVEDEYVIFSLEDFFPTCPPRMDLVSDIIELMKKDSSIGRADLTWDSFINVFDKNNKVVHRNQYKQLCKIRGTSVLNLPKGAPYRISTQPALWKKEYLLKFLDNDWSPWDFEVLGSMASNSMDEKIIACADSSFVNYPTKWVHKGAASRYHEDKINVLGLDVDTIKELVENKLVKEEKLQWGQWNGPVPSFDELCGYDFDPKMMPYHPASPTNWKEYTPTYNSTKEIINVFDNTFSHTKDLWGYITATGVDMWGRPQDVFFVENKMKYDGITFFVDHFISNIPLVEKVKSKYKVAWLLEPKALKPQPYEAILNHHDKFDLVITHDQNLIEKFDNCVYMQQAECRVEPESWGIHNKTKKTSLIAAKKKILEGHRFRYEVAEKLHDKHGFDLWGAAFDNRFENKTDALKDYMFSITIHNTIENNFFTDGIVDCFALGTIPIFRGCPNIGDFFDKNGIISFTTIEELDIILSELSEKDYYERLESVKNNYEIAKKFKKTNEDQIIHKVREFLYRE